MGGDRGVEVLRGDTYAKFKGVVVNVRIMLESKASYLM